MHSKNYLKLLEYTFYIVFAIITVLATIYIIQNGLIYSINQAQNVIQAVGIWGIFLFIFLQVFQVVIPFIPGGMINSMGVLLYGPLNGFLLNMVGIVAGSMVAFMLARRFGFKIASYFFDPVQIDKYRNKIDQSKHTAFGLTIAIALPGFPDDLLVYLTGILTKFSLIKFLVIMIIGRAVSLAFYSIGIDAFIEFIRTIL
jgi:uncharacterized membrane protein YdjX (TVP38/TMEM64 family)